MEREESTHTNDTTTDARPGFFGEFGGRYVAEVLRGALDDLDREYRSAVADDRFWTAVRQIQAEYTGRPTPLLFAENSTNALGGARLFIKLEGLANTGAHKINNAVGQALLAKRMGKQRIIAETGAGQHGLATAAVCAKLGLACTIYMGGGGYRAAAPQRLHDGTLWG